MHFRAVSSTGCGALGGPWVGVVHCESISSGTDEYCENNTRNIASSNDTDICIAFGISVRVTIADSPFITAEEHRNAYYIFLTERISHSSIFVNEAQNARK